MKDMSKEKCITGCPSTKELTVKDIKERLEDDIMNNRPLFIDYLDIIEPDKYFELRKKANERR